MKYSDVPEFETDLNTRFADSRPATAKAETVAGIGISVRDNVQRQLLESVTLAIGLVPVVLSEDMLELDSLGNFELIVADEAIVQRLRLVFATREDWGARIPPALLGLSSGEGDGRGSDELGFAGVLRLPQSREQLAAQLSMLVFWHREFATRYESAFDELTLSQRIYQSVTTGITVASATLPDMPLVYANPAFVAMTGYRLDEVIGRNCRFLEGAERNQPALTIIRAALREQREAVTVLKNFRKDGTPFWNELSLSPIRNLAGKLTHFVGIQTDVTARVEIEAALRESEKLAAVGRLASSIAHEINNPLESVVNLVYLAERSDDITEIKAFLAIADKELQRVKSIAAQSLRFYKQSTKPQAVGSKALLDPVLDVYQSRLQNARVTVVRRERAVASILCMESEIRQVLNNLVSNAIDAMQGRGGRLLVRTREAKNWRTGAHGMSITVSDEGVGMSAETLKEIYVAFFTTKGVGGTGLGLWVSSEIVDRHRGSLKVRSSQRANASGTVFSLFLPYPALPVDEVQPTKEQAHEIVR